MLWPGYEVGIPYLDSAVPLVLHGEFLGTSEKVPVCYLTAGFPPDQCWDLWEIIQDRT